MKIKCNRCQKIFSGKDEYSAEQKFNGHKCKGRDLNEMPMHLLKRICRNELTEVEAWKIVDRTKELFGEQNGI